MKSWRRADASAASFSVGVAVDKLAGVAIMASKMEQAAA